MALPRAWGSLAWGAGRMARGVCHVQWLEARNGIPRNFSSQVFGEIRVNFLGRIPTKTLHFVNRRSKLFRKFLGRLQVILCYWKTFLVPKWRVRPSSYVKQPQTQQTGKTKTTKKGNQTACRQASKKKFQKAQTPKSREPQTRTGPKTTNSINAGRDGWAEICPRLSWNLSKICFACFSPIL